MRFTYAILLAAALPLASFAQSNIEGLGPDSGPRVIAADPGYASQFRCPEAYPDDASRKAAVTNYLSWANQNHPDWRVADTMSYRTSLLRMHGCDMTLDDMVTNSVTDANVAN